MANTPTEDAAFSRARAAGQIQFVFRLETPGRLHSAAVEGDFVLFKALTGQGFSLPRGLLVRNC